METPFPFWIFAKKPNFIQPFLKEFQPQNIIFINPLWVNALDLALKKGLDKESVIFVWGRKEFSALESYAKTNAIPLVRVEDGFIRSLALGSDLTRPFSLVFDDRGIYFDSTAPSRLEEILQNTQFSHEILEEAKDLKEQILKKKSVNTILILTQFLIFRKRSRRFLLSDR